MSEKEIRAQIDRVCSKLDGRARAMGLHGARGALVPILLGAGLAAVACGDDSGAVDIYGAPGGYTSTSSTGTAGDGGSGGETGGSGGSGGETGGSGGSGGETGGSGGAGGGGGIDVGGGAMEYAAPDP